MAERHGTRRRADRKRAPKSSVKGFMTGLGSIVRGATRFAWRGLITAMAMGVLFGLIIGVGGQMAGIDQDQLYILAGASGWISGLVAMLVAFASFFRKAGSPQ